MPASKTRQSQRLLQGIAINTGGNQRKGNGMKARLCRQSKGGTIAAAQKHGLSRLSPRQMGPTVWITACAGSANPSVITACPVGQPPNFRQARAISAYPAAAKIAPQTPPPGARAELAALTMTSTCIVVMSCFTIVSGTQIAPFLWCFYSPVYRPAYTKSMKRPPTEHSSVGGYSIMLFWALSQAKTAAPKAPIT